MIPSELKGRLREIAVFPDFAREHEAAWPIEDAKDVVNALAWSRVAVVGVQGCQWILDELIPTNDSWSFPPTFGETESRRARRSRAGAAAFVATLDPDVNPWVVLEFSYQDDAA